MSPLMVDFKRHLCAVAESERLNSPYPRYRSSSYGLLASTPEQTANFRFDTSKPQVRCEV